MNVSCQVALHIDHSAHRRHMLRPQEKPLRPHKGRFSESGRRELILRLSLVGCLADLGADTVPP